jgi:Domain of unknown function (DUF1992)
MTERKPPAVSFPNWVEHQVRSAQAQGAFDNLPGTGKPIPDVDRAQDELAWVANYLRRENVDIVSVLPPALALAKEVEDLPERLTKEHSEARVRGVVADLNERIHTAHQQPQLVPPMRVRMVNVEHAVAEWAAHRAELAATAPAVPVVLPTPAVRRRGLFRRRTA